MQLLEPTHPLLKTPLHPPRENRLLLCCLACLLRSGAPCDLTALLAPGCSLIGLNLSFCTINIGLHAAPGVCSRAALGCSTSRAIAAVDADLTPGTCRWSTW